MKFAPSALRVFASGVQYGINGHPDFFPDPVVSMDALGAQIDKFGGLISDSLDRSRKVIAARDAEGAALKNMLRQLQSYVDYVANDDELIIRASGFNYVSTGRKQTATRSRGIRTITFGDISGTLKLKIIDVKGAGSYELRWAVRQIDRSPFPDEWTVKQFTDTRKFLIITGLTPGTYYVFQVHALIDEQHTDWSDSVTQLCV